MSTSTLVLSQEAPDFTGFLALPAKTPAPGLIVLQEIFGVNANMKALCEVYAGHGFVALCPDLFWRIRPGIALTDQTEAEWQEAFSHYKAFDVDDGVKDIDAAITTLRGHALVTEKVGAVGYCLGGLLAFLSATRTSANASVGFYGVGIQDHVSEAETLDAPLMLHIAGKDDFVPPAAQQAIHQALDHHRLVTLFDYPDQNHAFAREGGAHYNSDAADQANARTLDFLRSHLG
ncbi:MAG: dienelactone hydrolase family protein [Maricaulaceae bacterium]